MNVVANVVVENAVYAAVIGLVGLGAYWGLARNATRAAKAIVATLVVAAITFSVVVVTLDHIDGTGTSTESFIVIIASVPLVVAIALVVFIDSEVRRFRERHH